MTSKDLSAAFSTWYDAQGGGTRREGPLVAAKKKWKGVVTAAMRIRGRREVVMRPTNEEGGVDKFKGYDKVQFKV